MSSYDLETNRQFYEHDANCSKKNFTELSAERIDGRKRFKTCLDCAGIFDEDGKGIAITDIRFDNRP